MAQIKSISLSNFKGAENVTIDIQDRMTSPVITLVGLNESGKTTILEGMSYFVTGDNAVSSIFQGIHSKSEVVGLIPVHRKAAFTDKIIISAKVALDDSDLQTCSRIAAKYKLRVSRKSFPSEITISRIYDFEDSVLTDWNNDFDLELMVSSGRSPKERLFVIPEDNPEGGRPENLWDDFTEYLEERLPRISYFPTFLVDLPARIYLKEHQDERPVNRYYRYVFQDILNSLGGKEPLSLEKHVSKRIEDFKVKENSPDWFSIFFGGPSKAPIDSVFQKISNAVTREVLGSWRRVFQRPIAAKSISIDWNIDTQKGDLPYASFFVSDGESRYAINERSLGFRWFFSFLLFTAFKQASSRSTLFLFDEPAANLHAKAQAELLTSFSRIAASGHRVIYSTHSHHMINPTWLSGAYIVENTAIDHDSNDSFGLSTKPTSIVATRYRHFVSQHPNRTSYFQPVLEKLEYVTPEIVGSAPYVVVEGITDFYALKLVEKILPAKLFSLMPGGGAGALGPLISLLLGRGEKFIILLDDDHAGSAAAARYRAEWYLPEGVVMTLGEIDPDYRGLTLEGLISPETRTTIKAKFDKTKNPTKKEIGLYLAEMCAIGHKPGCLSADTERKLVNILKLAGGRLAKI